MVPPGAWCPSFLRLRRRSLYASRCFACLAPPRAQGRGRCLVWVYLIVARVCDVQERGPDPCVSFASPKLTTLPRTSCRHCILGSLLGCGQPPIGLKLGFSVAQAGFSPGPRWVLRVPALPGAGDDRRRSWQGRHLTLPALYNLPLWRQGLFAHARA